MPELLLLDLASGVPCGAQDHVIKRHPQGEKLAHHIEHVFHAGVGTAGVQVCGDRVGKKALLHNWHRDPPGETPAAVPDIEKDAAPSTFEQRMVCMTGGVQLTPQSG